MGAEVLESFCDYLYLGREVRDKEGTHYGQVFPNNPEAYKLASSLYGPGSVYGWHLVLLSVLLNWIYYNKDDKGYFRPGMSTDLLAAVLYPVIAAIDLIVLSIRLAKVEHVSKALNCLYLAETHHIELDGKDMPEAIITFGQRIIEITGPLAICYEFLLLSIIVYWTGSRKFGGPSPIGQPTKPARWFLSTSLAVVLLALISFQFSLDNVGHGLLIIMAKFCLILNFYLFLGAVVMCGLPAVLGFGCGVAAIVYRSWKGGVTALVFLIGYGFGGYMLWCERYFERSGSYFIVPDLGFELSDKDQLAALLVGALTLLYTSADIGYKIYKPPKDGKYLPI